MQYDNPAGRLLEILQTLKAFEKGTDSRVAWRHVFGIPKTDVVDSVLGGKIATVMLLPSQAVAMLVEEHPELADPLPSWVGQVTSAFMAHNMHGQLNTFVDNISADTLTNIRITAALIDKGSKRKILTSEERDSLRLNFSTILDEVLNSKEPDQVKTYVVRALRKIIVAIEEYELTGAMPIQDAIEQTVGHAVADDAYKNFLMDTELGQRVLNSLSAASSIVTVAVGLPVLANGFTKLLTGG